MIKHFDELTVGMTLFKRIDHAGLIEFAIVALTRNKITLEKQYYMMSQSMRGFSRDLTQKKFDELVAKGSYYFNSREEAVQYEKEQESKHVSKYMQAYTTDKEAFIKKMIDLAYEKETDSENGNRALAEAIRQLTSIHFPETNR